MKKGLLVLIFFVVLLLSLGCNKQEPLTSENKGNESAPNEQMQDDLNIADDNDEPSPNIPEYTDTEYLGMLIKGELSDGRCLHVSGVAEPIRVESAHSYPASSAKLPKELSQKTDGLYLPVVYDEKDIYPESQEQYVYVMCADSFHSSTWVEGISNISFSGGALDITFETFNRLYGDEGATYTLSVIKIDKASLSQEISKINIKYNETTQEEYMSSLFDKESAEVFELSEFFANRGIEEIRVVEDALVEKLALNLQSTTENDENKNLRISRTRFYDGEDFINNEAEKYRYIVFSYTSDSKKAKIVSLISAELNSKGEFVFTFDVEYEEDGVSDDSCTLVFVKIKREKAISFGMKLWSAEICFE